MDFPSAELSRRLGRELRRLLGPTLLFLDFNVGGFRSGDRDFGDDGPENEELDCSTGRPPALGGCGNAATLTVLRNDLSSALFRDGILRAAALGLFLASGFSGDDNEGRLLWEESLGAVPDEDRSFEASCGVDGSLEASGEIATLFRGFAEGIGGKAPVGGFVAGRDGVGIEAIVGYGNCKRATGFGSQ